MCSSLADPEDVARRVEFDKDRVGDGVGEVLRVREGDSTIVSGARHERRALDVRQGAAPRRDLSGLPLAEVVDEPGIGAHGLEQRARLVPVGSAQLFPPALDGKLREPRYHASQPRVRADHAAHETPDKALQERGEQDWADDRLRAGVGIGQAGGRTAVQHQARHSHLLIPGSVHGLQAAEGDSDSGGDHGDIKLLAHFTNQRREFRGAERADTGAAVSWARERDDRMSRLGVQTPPAIALCGAMAAGKEQHWRSFPRHLHDLHGSRARRDYACLNHDSSLAASGRVPLSDPLATRLEQPAAMAAFELELRR